MLVKIFLNLLPVFLFLVFLIRIDRMKLVKLSLLFLCFTWGAGCAALCLMFNSWLHLSVLSQTGEIHEIVVPVVEELMKGSILLLLVVGNRIGFMVDGAVYGFAVGAGFSMIENLLYVFQLPNLGAFHWVWVARGFGTALMHGGTTMLFAIVITSGMGRGGKPALRILSAALLAVSLHLLFNSFLIHPLVLAAVASCLLPVIMVLFFRYENRAITRWLDLNFYAEAQMLLMLKKGLPPDSGPGAYISRLRDHFRPEEFRLMKKYLVAHLELSLEEKKLLMLKEAGLLTPGVPGSGRRDELARLRKQIGSAGCHALAPLTGGRLRTG